MRLISEQNAQFESGVKSVSRYFYCTSTTISFICKNSKFDFSYVTAVCEHELQDINVTDDEKLKLILKTWGCTDFYDILIGNFLFNIPKSNDYNLILIDVAEKLNYDKLKFLKVSAIWSIFGMAIANGKTVR